jgi:hypothetical protein
MREIIIKLIFEELLIWVLNVCNIDENDIFR